MGGTGIKKTENKGNKRVWLEMTDCLLESWTGAGPVGGTALRAA